MFRKLSLSLLKDKYLNTKIIYLSDIVLSAIASVFVILAINLLADSKFYAGSYFLSYVGVSIVASAILFWVTRTYRIIIRHLSIKDTIPFALAALGKVLVLGVFVILTFGFSRAVYIEVIGDFLLTLFLLLGVRVVMILAYDALKGRDGDKSGQMKVYVYGTSDKSVSTIIRLQNSPHYKIIGFINYSESKHDITIDRLPVHNFNSEESLEALFAKGGFDAILFASEHDAQLERNRLIQFCTEKQIKCLIMPSVDEVPENGQILKPRAIKIEDLLGREEIKISVQNITEYVKGKSILVTGAAGSIGSELCRQLVSYGVGKLILFDNAETPMHNLRLELEDSRDNLDFVPVIGDVRNRNRLDFVFRTWHPQIVFHAAAYKHVPLMEENPAEAVHVNVIGTRNVADKCLQYDVDKMVMISTDKAVNPTNIMGCSKRLAEIYVQSLGTAIDQGTRQGKTRFVTTRFGNVLGSNGSVIPRFNDQIAHGGPVTVTHPEITRFFMTIPEACRLVMEAATMSTGNQIFIFDMGVPVKIDTLARNMISLAGFVPDKDIKIEYTGLRPGEKLYEEVRSNAENTLPSFHEKIRIAKVREYQYDSASAVVEELERLTKAVDIPALVRLMKDTVPEFKSKNSEFEKYDKN